MSLIPLERIGIRIIDIPYPIPLIPIEPYIINSMEVEITKPYIPSMVVDIRNMLKTTTKTDIRRLLKNIMEAGIYVKTKEVEEET